MAVKANVARYVPPGLVEWTQGWYAAHDAKEQCACHDDYGVVGEGYAVACARDGHGGHKRCEYLA